MKYISCVLLLTLTGCAISDNDIMFLENLCQNNGGIKLIYPAVPIFSHLSVLCSNGAEFRLSKKLVRSKIN